MYNCPNIVKRLYCNDERLIGVYVGLWMGDGTQYCDHGYIVRICSNKEDENLNAFIRDRVYKIFRKNTVLIRSSSSKRASILLKSRFIFEFINNYVHYEKGKKTYSVRLKEPIRAYNNDFLRGCLLGLVLSDGYIKKWFAFNVTSKDLAQNMKEILVGFGFNPHIYVHDRRKYGWKDLHMITLTIKESKRLSLLLDEFLSERGYNISLQELKYGRIYGPRQI